MTWIYTLSYKWKESFIAMITTSFTWYRQFIGARGTFWAKKWGGRFCQKFSNGCLLVIRFQSLLKLLLWTKGVEWVKVLSVLDLLCIWQFLTHTRVPSVIFVTKSTCAPIYIKYQLYQFKAHRTNENLSIFFSHELFCQFQITLSLWASLSVVC